MSTTHQISVKQSQSETSLCPGTQFWGNEVQFRVAMNTAGKIHHFAAVNCSHVHKCISIYIYIYIYIYISLGPPSSQAQQESSNALVFPKM